MPLVAVNGAQLFYEEQGTGLQTVFFAHGLALSGRMFHHQVLALRDRFRCITMDFRGQGRSEVTDFGYSLANLTQDVVRLIQRLDDQPCHFVGLSMGGFVGLRIALERPELLRTLTLLNTGARAEPLAAKLRYNAMIAGSRLLGLRPFAGMAMRRLFGRSFLRDPVRADERKRWRNQVIEQDRLGLTRAARGVITRRDISDRLAEITTPTLIISGAEDVAQPPELGRELQRSIPAARHVVLPNVGHASCLEAPERVNELLRDFLADR